MTRPVIAIIDGAARGNPGPAAYGVIFKAGSKKVLARLGAALGETTNNVAEYRALLAALAYARGQGWSRVKVQTDSELLAHQIDGSYKVRSPDLKPLHQQAQQLIAGLAKFEIEAVPRKLTREADKLANAALDGRPVKTRPARKSVFPAAAEAIAIRVAAAADCERIAQLSGQLGYPASPSELARRLNHILPDREHAVYVAESPGGEVVGWLHAFVPRLLISDSEAEVSALVVEEGRRERGIGRLLMHRAEEWARRMGCRAAYLRSNVVRKDAHAFYARLGYTRVKTSNVFRKPL